MPTLTPDLNPASRGTLRVGYRRTTLKAPYTSEADKACTEGTDVEQAESIREQRNGGEIDK